MSYAIIGFGAVGQALARMFARRDMAVSVATTRPPETLAAQARAIGPKVAPATLQAASQADIVLLAIPFAAHREIAQAADWAGKTLVDVSNAYGVPPESLGGLASSSVVARTYGGAKVVKAFNHLGAETLAQDPAAHGGRRVIFVASDDEAAAKPVSELIEALGFASIGLGRLEEGGRLVQARGESWAPLIFQDVFKFD